MSYKIVERDGRFAVIRLLPSGDAAGYDLNSALRDEQRHFAIHRAWANDRHIDMAFTDSRKYGSREDAESALAHATGGE